MAGTSGTSIAARQADKFAAQQSSHNEQQPQRNLSQGVQDALNIIRQKLATYSHVIVGVAGGSASGKTSEVAMRILEALKGDAMMVSMDDYERDIEFVEGRPKVRDMLNFDSPTIINMEKLLEDLESLKAGRAISMPKYDFETGKVISYRLAEPKKVIIVEGLYALNPEMAEKCDLKIFVQAGRIGQMIRRLIRDEARTGRSNEETLRRFVYLASPAQEKTVDPMCDNADIVIMNEYNPTIESTKIGTTDIQFRFAAEIDEKRLLELGAKKVKTVWQHDEYYIFDTLDTHAKGELLRVRLENGKAIFYYKGPEHADGSNGQAKIEFEIGPDYGEIMEFLNAHSYGRAIVEKERTAYELDGVVINIDRNVSRKQYHALPRRIGNFVEVVVPIPEAAGNAMGLIGRLGLENRTSLHYANM